MDSHILAFWGGFVGPYGSIKGVLDPYWPTLVVATVVSLFATPVASFIAFKVGILDLPDEAVKTHKRPTAYLGGVAVLVGFLAAMLLGVVLVADAIGPESPAIRIIYAICAGAVVATLVGLIDDVKDIRPWQKLIGQGICAVFLVAAGIKPDLQPLSGIVGVSLPPLLHDIVAYVVVLFFVLGATNSLNLLDGLDGLCAGVTAIITLGFLVLAIHLATWATDTSVDAVRIVVGLALVGSVFGFLMFNRHPAAIFLGDAGSILLGFIMASMMMLMATNSTRWWFASVVIFGLPILDTTTALIRRVINKRPIMKSDRGHIYDQMIDRGMPLERTVAVNYLLAGLYVLLGVVGAVFLRTRHAVILYLAIAVVSLLIVWRKGFFKMSGLRGAVRS
ncbi:MAG: undecaprenyl/decaprenyl-phosphate alpha-N-acetylglucosaminyl 1-phosphate transferase [Phycisphaerae bacterium]|nr:undecaprenyl/decaprenyl-phosphate alpha-N-acetylglucosaminyl 1-phosphate transferase [Phycisphaerae bacterium]